MKIKVLTPYKSISRIADLELPKFVIISGLNGAGKTQLLQGISSKKINLEINGEVANNIKSFSRGLSEVSSKTFYASKLESYAIALQEKINAFAFHKENYPQFPRDYETHFNEYEKSIIQEIKKTRKVKDQYLAYADRKEIMSLIPPHLVLPDPSSKVKSYDAFQHDLSFSFKNYQIAQENNSYNQYLVERKNIKNLSPLSDEEFIKKYGEPPWVIANEILNIAKLDYSFTTPEGQGITDSFTVKLIKNDGNQEISFFDLSSGEKVLMSLALALYSDQFNNEFPEVLLLDEPDCHLHPSMIGKLINIIDEVFVNKRNISVILTTHSPTTVALAKEDYLYYMTNEGDRISKKTKDRCIKNLTVGVPALSINYDNRVQVFVESKYDARNYGDIYEILKTNILDDFSLNFISSGSGGSGSSTQVKEIVQVLRNNGSTKVYGIIDWDKTNSENDYVKVVSLDKRYSLENLIFDPLLVGIYLFRESIVQNKDFGLKNDLKYIQMEDLTEEEMQIISDYVIGKINVDNNKEVDITDIQYVGGANIKVEKSFLTINGHVLEHKLKVAFPQLNRFRNENDLKSEIIKKVMADLPQFIPKELMDIFQMISSEHLH